MRLALALLLLAAAGCARTDRAPVVDEDVPPPAPFDCEGLDVTAQYVAGYEGLTLAIEGRADLSLPRVPADAGMRFARANASFWLEGATATLVLGDRRWACAVVGDDTPPPAAAEPLFHGVGQEPGWTVDVFADRIAFVGDYGEREAVVPTPEAEHAGTRTVYRAETADHALVLTIEERPCRDGMSGAPYPATVTLVIDGDRYAGCGR